MSAMASKVTSLTMVYSTAQIKENLKAPWPLWAQRASNAENVSIDDVIIVN